MDMNHSGGLMNKWYKVFCNAYTIGFSIYTATYNIKVLTKEDSSFGDCRGHGGALITHSPSTSVVCSSNHRPYLEKLVVAYRRSTVYSTGH